MRLLDKDLSAKAAGLFRIKLYWLRRAYFLCSFHFDAGEKGFLLRTPIFGLNLTRKSWILSFLPNLPLAEGANIYRFNWTLE